MIGLVSIVAACSDDHDLSMDNKGKEKPVVTITETALTDDLFSFRLEVSQNTAQYAYVILEGKENATPDPRDILFKEVTGAMEEETYHAKDTPSAEIEVKCNATESYQVFAAAITSSGLIGEVSKLDITAPDTEIPVLHSYTYNGNEVTLEFFEAVKRGKGRVMVRHMQETDRKILDLVYLTEDDIKFSEGNAVLTCPRPLNGTANGAVFMLSFEKGAFVDYTGNECDEFWSKYNDQEDTFKGVCWADDNVNFPIMSSYFKEYPKDYDWESDPTIQIVFPFNIYDSYVAEPIEVVYNELDGIKTMFTDNYTIGEDKRTVTITLPKKPEGYFDVSIKEGVFYDVWGNESNAFSSDIDNLRYQVDLPEPILGTYRIEFEEGPFMARFEKHEDDDHVVIYANWFNIWEDNETHGNPILRGVINKARKTITFDGTFYNEGNFTGGAFGRGLYYYDDSHNYMLAFWGSGRSGEDPITMRYNDEGYIYTTTSFEYAIHQTNTSIETGSYGKVKDGTSLTFITSESEENEQ